ncbi:MAG: hypothetical protein IMZ54_07885 [Acidobacteria bacterium]|nr:hypothetical protein [Acidobacteriota bacterium]
MLEKSKDSLLRSWKDISAYLGCDVRTCYRWEKQHGMPVHRAEGGEAKSHVFAYKDELDRWFQHTFKSSRSAWVKAKLGRRYLIWAAGAAVVLLAGAFFIVKASRVRRQPADFSIDGSTLIVRDKDRRELWRKDTKMEGLLLEDFYRRNFQVIHKDEANMLPSLVIRDINGDGLLETVAESFHAPDWPCQLAVLDSSGKMVGEFWNAGYLRDLTYHDIDGDGREELIVCGVTNEYRGGCLIVFDTRDIRGSSPQSGEFLCEGLGAGSELYYVTVPFLDISKAMGDLVAGLRDIDITENDRIRVTTTTGLWYEFGFDLKCVQVSWGHGYIVRHEEMVKAGRIASVLDEAFRDALFKGIRYWNGSEWTAEPARNR